MYFKLISKVKEADVYAMSAREVRKRRAWIEGEVNHFYKSWPRNFEIVQTVVCLIALKDNSNSLPQSKSVIKGQLRLGFARVRSIKYSNCS